jgi:hypothetical protein
MVQRNDHRSVVGYLPSTRKMTKIGMPRIQMEIGQRHYSCGASPKGGIENGFSSVMDMTMLLCL